MSNSSSRREHGGVSFVRETGVKMAEESEPEISMISPLPFFGHCSEIHSSNAPDILSEPGESDKQAERLFSHIGHEGTW